MTEIKTICVFCGSRAGLDPDHEKAARDLGHAIADRGIKLVYGGGDIGLMSIVDDVDDVFGALESAPEPDIEVLTSHL